MLDFFRQVREDLELVEQEIKAVVQSRDPLLTQTSMHLLNAGGKRLRPAFALLAGKLYNYSLEKLLPLAVALELIHMASLVHDDVVDNSQTRRGTPTVKANWGNAISMHTGDYLFAKSLVLISQYENPVIAKVLAETSVKMCEGEIHQISTAFKADQSWRDYFYRIERKTALLIAASCQLGAVAAGAPVQDRQRLRRFGHQLGMAFQITDDVLDMVADQSLLGKPLGGDLRQGILTMPVLYSLEKSPQRRRLRELVEIPNKTDDQVKEAIDIIKEAGGIEFSFEVARRYIDKAKNNLALLPDRPVKQAFYEIADFIGIRRF
ncbi:polyprenyl synthetase family protein [Desulforamulus hydrothermalis]|uniref:Heptaprenyl diphosphate synthase component 2 n=1 Tax=Desulforamulus hydrothermalis Lam5 = DSM 18033 TaxID=1121428 RepID=K8E6A2_9FIRM|nr:polyprenyl synthetase family protein [Desulforamulus hydrothermalis]CCO06988.1 Heptaprenyl diphosphate synthase component 2 [Desulforamulus hydrothermalis Lam5 = DSM 18033]SHG98195.1 heptaprenyl diphosphate synthase [Desulforamulus hydrothermalis Lam5 = DSM 18033]